MVVYDPRYADYYFGPDHPFSPLRQAMLLDLLDALGHPPAFDTPPPATREDLLTVHSEALVEQVEAAGRGTPLPDAEAYGLGTADVPLFAGMDEAARLLVGGTLYAARAVAEGRTARVLQLGGGLHHARRERAGGFCVYNDLAVAIRHLTHHGLRVAYIDIDVHHGDGVQDIHYSDGDVLTVSLHESGYHLYPGTGHVAEMGEAAGLGFKLNAPLEPGTDDASYLEVFERVVPHTLAWFQPDVLVVQCGADAHFHDPLAHLQLTTHAYERLFRRLIDLTDTHAGGRAIFTLGGGYHPGATVRVWALLYLMLHDLPIPDVLPPAWRVHWEERLGARITRTLHDPGTPPTPREEVAIRNRTTSKQLMEHVVRYWY